MTLHKPFYRAALVATVLVSAAFTFAVDDSTWINAGISQAVAAGQHSYAIPEGTYYLSNPIVIPSGTRDFSLLGAGSGLTHIRANNKLVSPGHAIQVGPNIISNWPVCNWSPCKLATVKEGVTTVYALAGEPLPPVGLAYIYDDFGLSKSDGVGGGIACRAEPIQVVSVNTATRAIVLDVPAGRDYDNNPRISTGNIRSCANITVSGFEYDGLTAGGVATTGLMYASGTFGLQLTDLKVKNFETGAIQLYMVRNALIQDCLVDGAVASGPGNGYGIQVQRSRYVTINNCETNNSRHGVILHAGTMDTLVQNCHGATGFDSHGFDERRVTLRNCSYPSGIDLGNDGWVAGAKDILIDNCDFGAGNLWVHPRIRNLLVRNTKAGQVRFFWLSAALNKSNLPGYGIAENSQFEDCTFAAPSMQQLGVDSQTKSATFLRCTFTQTTKTTGSAVINLTNASGTFNFVNCSFIQNGWNSTAPIMVNGSPNAVFLFQNCKIDPRAGRAAYGYYFGTGFAGKVTLNYCLVYESPNRLGETFLYGQTTKVKGTGNTLMTSKGTSVAVRL